VPWLSSRVVSATRIPNVLLVREAAERARVSQATIRAEIKAGRLRARRIARCVRILDNDLATWLTEGISQALGPAPKHAASPEREPMGWEDGGPAGDRNAGPEQ